MGTILASGELNYRLRPIIANILDTAVIQDDIVVATAVKETHYQMLEPDITALEKAASANASLVSQKSLSGDLKLTRMG